MRMSYWISQRGVPICDRTEEFVLGNGVESDLKNAWEVGTAKVGLFSMPQERYKP